ETWPKRRRRCAMTASSRGEAPASVAWPPSLVSTAPPPCGSQAATPRPVPGPSTAIGASAAGSPPPIRQRSAPEKCGSAQAIASKSLISRTREKSNAICSSAASTTHGLLVSAQRPPSTTPATASTAASARSRPERNARNASVNCKCAAAGMCTIGSSSAPCSTAKRALVPPMSPKSTRCPSPRPDIPRPRRSPVSAQLAAHDGRTIDHRLELAEGDLAREVLHAAVRRRDELVRRDMLEAAADAGGDERGRLDRRRRQIEHAEHDVLRRQFLEHAEIDVRLRALHRDGRGGGVGKLGEESVGLRLGVARHHRGIAEAEMHDRRHLHAF